MGERQQAFGPARVAEPGPLGAEVVEREGEWAAAYKILTPNMRERGGSLGVCHMRLPPHSAAVPFHYHLREDEVFYVLAGRGVLRYGDELIDIIVRTANGRLTAAEALGHREFVMTKLYRSA